MSEHYAKCLSLANWKKSPTQVLCRWDVLDVEAQHEVWARHTSSCRDEYLWDLGFLPVWQRAGLHLARLNFQMQKNQSPYSDHANH